MSRIDEPRNVDHDDVAQRESDEDCCLNRVVPVFEWRVDGKQHEEDKVEDPVESVEKKLGEYSLLKSRIKPFLEHDNLIRFEVFHVDAFEKLLLARTQLSDMREDLSMQKVLVAVERIIGCLECLVMEPMDPREVVN